jgi:hypothetical protein
VAQEGRRGLLGGIGGRQQSAAASRTRGRRGRRPTGTFFRPRRRVARGGMRWIGPIGSPWDNPWVITH